MPYLKFRSKKLYDGYYLQIRFCLSPCELRILVKLR